MDVVSSIRVPLHSTSRISLALCLATALAADVSAEVPVKPQITIATEHWKSSTGACAADLEHATVSGVPPDVKVRIDANLATLLTSQSETAPLSKAKREAECAGSIEGRAFSSTETATWTKGLMRGRWLSMRLHVSSYASAAAHPSDRYAAITFDLDHGGYPVRRAGFYTSSQRPALNAELAKGALAALAANDPIDTRDPSTLASMRHEIEQAAIDESQLLLTPSGLEITGVFESEAARNLIVRLTFAELRGVGTPGGPLDPQTRT
jgi:hypothetical protein